MVVCSIHTVRVWLAQCFSYPDSQFIAGLQLYYMHVVYLCCVYAPFVPFCGLGMCYAQCNNDDDDDDDDDDDAQTLNICPSGYFSRMPLMITERGGRLCPNDSPSTMAWETPGDPRSITSLLKFTSSYGDLARTLATLGLSRLIGHQLWMQLKSARARRRSSGYPACLILWMCSVARKLFQAPST